MLTLAVTPGEPAGIGPELLLQVVADPVGLPDNLALIAVADPQLLQQRADRLGINITLHHWEPGQVPQPLQNGLNVLPVKLRAPAQPGLLSVENAAYVLETLTTAADACLHNQVQAMVTGPVHKGVINDAGMTFSGHTEFLAERCNVDMTVMMLATEGLRVALTTTHLPLRAVADAVTPARLQRVLHILHNDLQRHFGIQKPRILVCGLNPHAGEGGHLGREEIDIIEPVLNTLRTEGMNLQGPLPADTLFTPHHLENADAVLAMYHDQGLPVLKFKGFGHAANITLGLPIVRTSVDHGTALDLAGTGRASDGSLRTALLTACEMVQRKADS